MSQFPRRWVRDAFVAKREALGDEGPPTFLTEVVEPEDDDGPATARDFANLEEAKARALASGCADVPRPCPFVSCRYNLYLDVAKHGVRLNFPLIQPEQMPAEASCAIDVAMGGPRSAGDVAQLVGDGEVQMDQVERRAAPKLREVLESYEGHGHGREDAATPLGGLASAMQGGVERGLEEAEEDRSGRVLPDRFYLHLYPQGHVLQNRETDVDDEEYLRAVWKVYERTSRSRCEELAEAKAGAASKRRK